MSVAAFRAIVATAIATLLAAFGAALLVPASASAGTLPAICDEYPNLPQCEGTTDDGGNPQPTPPGEPPVQGPGGDDAGPTADQGSAGNLPFTGYPLTGLLLLLLILLLAGLTLRAYLAVRDRIAGNDSQG